MPTKKLKIPEIPSLADLGIRKWQKRSIKTKHKTTTVLGFREYMRKYMRLIRKKSPLLE